MVVNSSPLITLFKSKQSHLLPALFPEIVVPNAVWDEILAGGESDPAAQNLPTLDWITKTELLEMSPLVLAWDLGPGESEVLSFAFSNPDYTAIVDDAADRVMGKTVFRTLKGQPILCPGHQVTLTFPQ